MFRSFSPIRRLADASHVAAVCDFAPSGQNHAVALSEARSMYEFYIFCCGISENDAVIAGSAPRIICERKTGPSRGARLIGRSPSNPMETVMSPVPPQPNKKQATPRSRNLFRKTEIRRAIATAQAAGFSIQRIDVDSNGKFSVVLGPPVPKDAGARP